MSGEEERLGAEALVRRADRQLRTRHGDIHLLHEVEGVPDYRSLMPADWIELAEELVPVVALPRLRQMKRAARRPKDAVDLTELDALHGPEDEPPER